MTPDTPTSPPTRAEIDRAWRSMVETMPRPHAEQHALTEALALIPAGHGLRTAFGHLVVDAQQDTHPMLVDRARGWLQSTGSRFGMTPMPIAIAFTAHIGAWVYPDLPLVHASQAVMADALRKHPESPFVNVFVQGSDGHWTTFIRHFDKWDAIFTSNNPPRVIAADTQGSRIALHGPEAAARQYVDPGVMQGLMAIFGVEGDVRSVLSDDNTLTLTLTW